MEKKENKLTNALKFVFSTGNLDKREFGIDFIKAFATFSVLSVHYFLHNGYYNLNMNTKYILIPTAFRWLFYLGVPLFLLSTGYLKRKTRFCVMHYVKLTPVIVTSVLVGIITIFYKIFINGESYPIFIWIRSVWAYEQPSYSWYINMYLSLALIMPFISYGWNAIESQRKKQLTILVFLIMTAVPTQINRWIVIDSSSTNIGFAPNYYTNIYAITYFLIGSYIGEYKPKFKKWSILLVLTECLIYLTLKTYMTADGNKFSDGITARYEDLIIVVTSTAFFLLFYDLKINIKPIKAVIASISSVTLGLYLLSWIYDNMVYPIYKDAGAFDNLTSMFLTYFKIVPLGLLLSFLGATVVNTITKLITNPIIRFAAKKTGAVR